MPDYRGNSNKIYQTLKSDGVTGIGKDENEFYELMQKPDNRKKVFDYLTSNEYTGLGNNLDEFSSFVYDPSTNRAVQVEKSQNTWEQTVNNLSAGVEGAPMMLTPFGQNKWSKSSLQPDRIQKEALTPKKSKADRIIEQRNQTQPSPYKPLGTTYEMAKESMPEQKQMDEMFEQTMKDANKRFNKVYGREMQYVPSFSTNSFLGSHLNAVRQANKEVTPSKIIGAIQKKIMGAPQNTEGGNVNNAPADPIMQEVNAKQAALIYDYVRKKLIERNIPKSKWETFYRTMLSNNLLVNALKAATKTPEQLQYDAMSMSDERNPNKLGGIGKVTANVLGVVSDPTTYISGGVGSLATKGAMKLGMNTAAKFGTQQASRIMAMGATRMMPRLIGGAANFATFEGLGTFSGQIGSGQDVNLGEIGLSTLKGAGMGALMPLASSWMGRGVDRALGKYANTMGGKVGKYASDFTARTAVFAGGNVVQQWATNPNFDWRTADYGEIIADAAATNLGFDLLHLSKWATGKGEHETLAEANARKKAQIKNFFSNNPMPENTFALTMDDVRTAQKCGLDVKDIKGLVNELGNIAERDAKEGSKYNTDDTARSLGRYEDSGIGKFLLNENMTQSLRDKIATAITGRPFYSRVITHANMRQDEDGKYHVTTSNNLGVVEDRQFSNRREAEKWMYPQQELVRNGSVMELENLLHAKEFGKVLEDSGDIMAEDFNITPEELKAIISKNENELTPEEKIIVDEYNRRLGNRQLQSVARVRKAIADKYSISEEEMNRIADSDYNKLNSRDKNTFRAYQQELERLNKPVEEVRRDIEAQKNDAIINEEIDKTEQQIAQEEANSQLITDIIDANGEADTLIKLSTGEGVSLNQSYQDGKEMETSAVKQTLETIGKRLDPAVRQGIDKAFANGSLYDLLIQMDGKMDDNVISYIAAKNSQQGLTDGRVERAVAEATEGIMAQYGRTDGYVSKGIIDGKEVIITSEQGDEFCYYKNPETGEIERCGWDKLQDVPEVVDVENELVTARNMAAEGARASVEHEFAHEPETHADYKEGDHFYALNDKGEVKHQQVVGVDANGNVTYGELGDDGQPKDMKVATKEGLKQMEDEAYRVRNGIKEEAETPQENVTEGTATAEGASAEVMSEGEQTATEETEPQKPVSAYESIPKDNKGRTQWSQVSPDVAAKAMLEQHEGDEADALDTINLCIESAKASVEKAENAKIKASDDPDDFIAQKAKNRKAVEEAKKNLEFWKKVRFELQTDIPEEAEVDNTANDILAQKKAQASNKAKVDSIGLDEANSVYDYVLGWIASGAKFKWGDGPGSQGLKNETGYSRSDIPTFYLDNKNGQTPDQMAHAIWEAMPERLKSQTDDMEIKDHILNIMQSHKNYTEMADEFVRRHTVDESQFEGQRPIGEDANKPVDFTDVTTKDENGEDYPFSKSEGTSKTVEDAEPAKETMTVKERLSQQRASEEMKKQAVNAAVSEGKRLGTDIHVVNTPEELKNVLGDGYADMDADEVNAFTMPDGEIYIYAPSMTDSRFAIRQVWHEVVAHKGVKALLPAEDRKQFFKNVYDTMTDYAKDRFSRYVFDTLGAKSRKELGYDSYDELVQDKQAFETFIAKHSQKIADEYVARVYAENGDFERGVFQRMVDWFTHWAHEKFGGKLGIDKFSDADIRYILGESQEKLANGEDIKPIGTGSFGEIYDQFKGKAKEAIAFLMKKKGGEALGALHHKDIGDIDLVWGKEGTAKSDGYGLSKIVKYHPEVLNNLQEILDDMEVKSRSDNRINLESEKYQASVRLTWDDQKKTWLLTAFKKKETSEPTNSRTDVDSNLNGKSDDTATRQSSDVSSDGKGTLSSTNNQGENPKNATFSKKEKKEDEKKLYGVHNLTEENLLHAVKMGGLANPSTAVVRIDRDGLNSFGDISLLMPPSMIEKKSGRNAGTWSADAYSPRYPRNAVRGDMSSKGQDKFNKDIETASDNEKMRREIRDGWSQYINYNDKRDALYYWYLEDKGLTPEKVMEKPVELKSLDKAMIDATGGKDWVDLSTDEKDQIKQNYVDYTVAKFEKMFRHQLESGEISKDEYKDKIAKVRKDETEEISEDGIYNLYDRAYHNFKYSQKTLGVDTYKTAYNARVRVQNEGLEKDFNDWLDGKKQEYEVTESVFDGFDSKGYRKYRPHTLANISKMMKKSGKAGAEELFATSPGALRAKIAPIYGKLDDIRKNKDKIISSNEFEKIKNQISEEFFDLSALVRGKMGGDEGFYRLEEAMKHGAEWLNKNYSDIDLDKEDIERIEAFRTFLKEAPTEYFETKFERPVMLNEFVGAVVPKTMGDKARKALEDAGLKLYDYDPNIEGDRQKVIENATQENDILFSRKDEDNEFVKDRKAKELANMFRANALDEFSETVQDYIMNNPAVKEKLGDGSASDIYDYLMSLNENEYKRATMGESYYPVTPYDRLHSMSKDEAMEDVEEFAFLVKNNFIEDKVSNKEWLKKNMPELVNSVTFNENARPTEEVRKTLGFDESAGVDSGYSEIDDDVLENAVRARELDRKGEDAVRFAIDEYKKRMKAFHGSGADFDHFDIKFLGTGEGAQAYGIGHYVTEVKGIGETYAMASAGKAKYKGKVVYSGDPYSNDVAERAFFYIEQEHGRKEAVKFLKEMMKDEEDADTINDYKETIKVILDEKNWEAPTRMLYSVEIPEDNGSNYLSWDKPITDKQAQTIERKLVENDKFLENSRNMYESILNGLSDKSMMPSFEDWIQDRASVIVMSGKENGQRLYKEFENMLGSDKEASEFLGSIGFVGVVYPAEYRSGGREDNAHNYVIFDDSDLAITDKVRFSKREEQSYKSAFKDKDEKKASEIVRDAFGKAFPDTKIVDKKGNPLIVYHGTYGKFNAFRHNPDDIGFHFGSKGIARTRVGRSKNAIIKPCYLHMDNPIEFDTDLGAWDADKIVPRLIEKNILTQEEGNAILYNSKGYLRSSIYSNKDLREVLLNKGYDGIIYENYYESDGKKSYIVFRPNQIKSAEPFTYDNAGNLIPLEERFNDKSNDVRFSKKETDDKERPHLYGGLYSNAEKAVLDIKQNKATADQWLNMLKNNGGLKEGEDKWVGLSDWLKLRRGMTTKDEVLDFIRKNAVEIEEVNYTESEDAPKEVQDKFDKYMNELGDEQEAWDKLVDEYGDDFDIAFWVDEGKVLINNAEAASTLFDIPARPIDDTRLLYTTKGLKNKREVALTVPTIEAYNENDEVHFGDADGGRAVAWCRFGETTDADGNRVLVVDEVQSKRHQDGRERGYYSPEDRKAYKAYKEYLNGKYPDGYLNPSISDEMIEANKNIWGNSQKLTVEEQTKLSELQQKSGYNKDSAPVAPFDKNWHELVMKRMLRYAAENGYDKVAWTSGEQQAERYNIGNVVNSIEVSPYEAQSHNEVDGFDVDIHVNDADTKTLFVSKDGVISGGEFAGMKLADVLGKELANDILSTTEYREIDGKDLRIGGEGMKGFYDKILPNFMNKFGKKFGAKVGVVTLPDVEEAGREMWSVDVTPEMKRTAMEEGFPMFSKKELEDSKKPLEELNKAFNDKVDKFTEKDADRINFLLGYPSDILKAAGVSDMPMKLYGSKVVKKIGKHHFGVKELKDLPKKVAEPIAVFDNYRTEGNRSILTELTTKGGNILVAVNVGKGMDVDFNIIASSFGKGAEKVVNWLANGYATYIDKKKALQYLHLATPIVAASNNKELYDAANVVKSFDEAKFWNDYNTSQTKNNASVSANNNNLQSAVDNSGVNFSADENEPFERDAAGRPKSINITTSEILTDEGRAKYNAWANAVKEWDKAHPLDMKNRKAAAKAVASVVREALKGGGLNEVETAELNKFLNTMSNTSTTNIMDMSSRAFKVAAGAISKAHDKTINKLLNLKLTDKNGKNMSVAGSVDYNAQEIFEILKENWDNFDSDAVNKRIEYLNNKIDKHAEDVAEGKTPDEPWTQDDSNELTALETLLHNKTVKDIGNEIKEIIGEQKSLEAQKKENYQKYKNAEISPDTYKSKRDSLEAELESLDKELNERLSSKIDAEQAVIDKLTEIAEGGREDKKSWQERETDRKRDLIAKMNLNLWSDKKVNPQEMKKYAKQNAGKAFFTTMLDSFEYLAKNLNEYGAGKDSWFYNYFVRGKEGVVQAFSNYSEAMRNHRNVLDEKCLEIFGKEYDDVKKEMSKVIDHSGVFIKAKEGETLGVQGGKKELSLSKGQATYLYMLWKMNDGNAQLLRDGFDLDSMQEIEDFIGEDNVKFAEWMQGEYLPEVRKKYNDKYIEMFNTSLAHVDNYVPLKRVSEMAQQQSNLSDENNYNDTLSARTGAIINRTRSKNPIDLGVNAYQLIYEHLNEMEQWHSYARVRKDLDYILGNTHLRNKMNSNSAGMFNRLKDAAAVATFATSPEKLSGLDENVSKLSKVLAGAPIAYRYTTALKQYLSLPNGLRYATGDAKFYTDFARYAFEDIVVNMPAWLKNVATYGYGTEGMLKKASNGKKTMLSKNLSWCLQNIPDFYERVLKGTAGNSNMEFETWENALGHFADEYMKHGMISNQLVDAITCGIIIRSVYEGKMRAYKKAGMDETEADRLAKADAVIAYNASQQSSHPAFLAPAQKSKTALNRTYSLFNTANLGFARDFITSCNDYGRLFDWHSAYRLDDLVKHGGHIRPEAKSFYAHKLMAEDPSLTREEADKLANKEVNNAFAWIIKGLMYSGFIGALTWDYGGKGLFGQLQSTEEDEDKRKRENIKQFVSCPARGIPPVDIGVAFLTAILDDNVRTADYMKSSLFETQIGKIIKEPYTAYEDFGFSPELAYTILNSTATSTVGLDLNTHVNILQGVTAMVKDGIVSPAFGTSGATTRDKIMLDLMQILNTPKSNRKEVMTTLLEDKVRSKEISQEEWMKLINIAAGYKVDNDPVRSWMPNSKMVKETRKKALEKEFENYFRTIEQRKKLKQNEATQKEYAKVGKTDSSKDKFHDYASENNRLEDYMSHEEQYEDYKTVSAAYNAWRRLLSQGKDDEADKWEQEHKDEIERYKDNAGKFGFIDAMMKRLGKDGENDEETFNDIIKTLSE